MNPPSSYRWIWFTILVLTIGLAWIWTSRVPADNSNHGLLSLPHQGFQAPDFNLQTLNGDTITLSELHGHPIIINLWASWCPPCRAEMPALESVYQDYQDQGIIILAVNATNQDNIDEAKEFIKMHNLTFPILLDVNGEVSRLYQLRSLPTTYFVDGDGKIQEIVIGGPMAEALLRVRIEKLLKESRQ